MTKTIRGSSRQGRPVRIGRRDRRGVLLALLLLLVVACWVLGGCSLQLVLETRVRTDGGGLVSLRAVADRSLLEAYARESGRPVDGLLARLVGPVPAGWEVAPVEGVPAGSQGVTVRRSFGSPDELEQAVAAADGPGRAFGVRDLVLEQRRGILSVLTTYRATLDPLQALAAVPSDAATKVEQELASSFRGENRLVLPGRIRSSNADAQDGEALVWRVRVGEPVAMTAESRAIRWQAVLAIGATILLLVVAVVVWALGRSRRRSRPTSADGGATAGHWGEGGT